MSTTEGLFHEAKTGSVLGGVFPRAEEPGADPAFPVLRQHHLDKIRAISTSRDVEAGEILSRAGDASRDFFYLESAEVDLIRAAMPGLPEAVVLSNHPGAFLGELDMVTGQVVYLTTRVSKPGQVRQIAMADFRRLMAEDAELSEVVLAAFIARRSLLQRSEGAWSIQILGSRFSPEASRLRNWAARQHLAHRWVEVESPAGETLLRELKAGGMALPVAITPTHTIENASPSSLAGVVGLTYRPEPGSLVDLVVVGGGPAGLAAAVYGSSEGLSTVLFDLTSPGGRPRRALGSKITWASRRAFRARSWQGSPLFRLRNSELESRACAACSCFVRLKDNCGLFSIVARKSGRRRSSSRPVRNIGSSPLNVGRSSKVLGSTTARPNSRFPTARGQRSS